MESESQPIIKVATDKYTGYEVETVVKTAPKGVPQELFEYLGTKPSKKDFVKLRELARCTQEYKPMNEEDWKTMERVDAANFAKLTTDPVKL
mmetsp:Transcript_17413/g.29300  ORF Transcript_17413/g.29300 Transcript_17413/m.29300 type:complete len:92 (-) Transcript_17413:326-601(-)